MSNIPAGSTGTTPAARIGSHYANPSNPGETDSWRITGPSGLDVSGRLGVSSGGYAVSISSETAMSTTATIAVPFSVTQTSGYNFGINSHRMTGIPFDFFNEYAGTFTVIAPVDPVPDPPDAPAAPTTTGPPTGECLGGTVPLSWTAVSGATSYKVKRGGTILQSGITGTTYTDNTAIVGMAYSFSIIATGAGGDSLPSTALSVMPCSVGTDPDPDPGTTPAEPDSPPAAPAVSCCCSEWKPKTSPLLGTWARVGGSPECDYD